MRSEYAWLKRVVAFTGSSRRRYLRVATAWSPDGQILATCCGALAAPVGLWRPDGTAIRMLSKFDRAPRTIAWSPDSAILVVGDYSGQIRFWSRDGTARTTIPAAPPPTTTPGRVTPTTR